MSTLSSLSDKIQFANFAKKKEEKTFNQLAQKLIEKFEMQRSSFEMQRSIDMLLWHFFRYPSLHQNISAFLIMQCTVLAIIFSGSSQCQSALMTNCVPHIGIFSLGTLFHKTKSLGIVQGPSTLHFRKEVLK